MRIHRKITPTIALLLALSAAAPTSASAGSLLSGYGGPGQGNQAILGAGLVNGPSGGGGGGSGGGGPAAGSQGLAVVSGSVANTGAAGRPGAGAHQHGAQAGPKQSQVPAGGASAGKGAAYQAYERAVSSQRGVDSGLLGLSSSDLLWIVLAACALISTALLARGLARSNGSRRHAGS